MAEHGREVTPGAAAVVVGIDGSGRTHRLEQRAVAAGRPLTRLPELLDCADELSDALDKVRLKGGVLAIDDVHKLPGSLLQTLARAARRGVAMLISRRPTIGTPELAELDDAVAACGTVELLGPLDDAGVAALFSAVAGRAIAPEEVTDLREETGGLPAVLISVASAARGAVSPGLVARFQQRLATLDPRATRLARLLALRLDIDEDVLARAAEVDTSLLAEIMQELRDCGLLAAANETMIPAVARAVLSELPPAGRRLLHESVAGALTASGAEPVAAAEQLCSARARGPGAAEVYVTAAECLRFDQPLAALRWFELARESGAAPARVALGSAEAAAVLGRPVDLDSLARHHDGSSRVALVTGAIAAHEGRADRAAEAMLGGGPDGSVMAVPALVATGGIAQARARARGLAPLSVQRMAEAALAACEPGAALPLFIEAAEALEHSAPTAVLPDTPHALGAILGVIAGDVATAEYLLGKALASGVGGPVATDRHRALLAWARMRVGRYDTVSTELPRLTTARLRGRERLLVAALSAGVARRTGDIAQLRRAWSAAEPVLTRRAVDLFAIEVLEELLVAAARLREHHRVAPVLDMLDDILDRLDRPAAWVGALGWVRVNLAICSEDPQRTAAAATELVATAPGSARQDAQRTAAQVWVRILEGTFEADAVLHAAESLAAAQLPWEASRLAGHAGIRAGDPGVARRLLERAREFADPDRSVGGDRGAAHGRLSGREIDVARLVLAGCTHREVGAQLYLSPKTVEHHVARIRTKLGAGSRAELVAALRRLLASEERTP